MSKPAQPATPRKRTAKATTAAAAVSQPAAAALMHEEPPSKRAKVVAAAAPSVVFEGDSLSVSPFIAATAAALPLSLSIAQRCNRDCLSVILSFSVSLADVLSAAQTCRSWRAAAVHRQSSCRANKQLYYNRAAFLQMLQLPLRVHLARLDFSNARKEDLIQLHARCPQLEELTIEVDDSSTDELTESVTGATMFNAFAWPSSLRSLQIGGCGFSKDPIRLQPLINALSSSAICLRSLTLAIYRDDAVAAVLDLAPLLQLPELTSLRTYYSPPVPQLVVVRQLRSLTTLSVAGGYWERADLLALLADGSHQLQRLQKINIERVTVDIELMQALLTLPCLTELTPSQLHRPASLCCARLSSCANCTLPPSPSTMLRWWNCCLLCAHCLN
jgi:hypothetical protein